jgi:WD40 repeat protein
MAASPPSQPSPDTGGIHIGDVGGSVKFSALGDIVGGDKITTITTTIQISVEAVTQRPLITASPYRGLDRFEDRDKDLFFGRDQLIKSLLAQLSASNVLLVLGASGSGKSSVVRAGLLPQLSQLIGARFRYFTFVPDVNPFESLRSALQGAGFSQAQTRELADAQAETATKLIHTLQREGDQWLFFIDQFEEIFTVGDEKLRASFIAALVAIAQEPNSSTKLVLAMRADFLDRFSPFPQFAKMVEKNIDFVADMHADELRQAIEQPAARHGVVFEQGLVEEIIKDVQGQAGSLPLLQYTLDLLWQEEARDNGLADRHLNARAYRELGGVRGALQKRADEIYASFGDGSDAKAATPKQEIVRQIFLRLVDLAGEGSDAAAWRPVRRRASMTMFSAGQEQEILQALINQKLLVSNREGDDATVEVAHEALFTSWGRLKNWIEAGKQVIFARNRLADDARRWQRRQQEGDSGAEEELLGGSRLAQALDMRARGDFVTVVGGLGETETQFLDASAALRDRRATEEQTRQQRELEAAQRLAEARTLAAGRLRKGLAIAVVLALLAVAGGVLAWLQSRKAAANERNATRALSQSDFLRASDLLAQDEPREALAFLARACRINPENSAVATQLFFLLSQKEWILPVTEPLGHGAEKGSPSLLEYIRFSPDGSKVVATSWDETGSGTGTAQVWDINSRKLLLDQVPCNISTKPGQDDVFPALRQCLPNERCFRASLVLIPHGKEVKVCDLQQGKVRMTLPHATNVTAVQFSATGNKVLTGDEAGEVRLWDIDGKEGSAKRFQVASSKPALKGAVMAFNRSGTQAVVGTSETIEIWKLDAARESATPLAPRLGSKLEAVSEDGRHVLIGDSLYSWDPDTGLAKGPTLAIKQPEKDRFSPLPAAFSNDGKWVATLALKQIQLHGTAGGGPGDFDAPQNRRPPSGGVVNAAERPPSSHLYFSSDASLIASIFEEESIQIWNTKDKTQSRESLSERQPFTDVAFSPDGRTIATASYSGSVQIWDIGRALPERTPISLDSEQEEDPGASWKLSEDGRFVLLTTGGGERKVFDSKTGKPATAPAGVVFPKEPEIGIENQSVEEKEKSLEEYSLVNPATGKLPTPPITVTRGTTVRWSRAGQRFLTLTSVRREIEQDKKVLTIRNASTGAQLREPLECFNAWFSFAGDAVLIATAYRGTVVMDIATGRDLAVLPNIAGDSVQDAAWTSEGITVLAQPEFGSSPGLKARLFHFDFWLAGAPTLLADIAEGFAQLTIDEAGIPQSKTVLLPELCKLAESAAGKQGPQTFVAWAKAFAAARGTDPGAPNKK